MKIGEVIRKYRKEKQLTQEEMAKFLGVTAPAVNKWENGNSFPDITLLAPIARLLGITTDTLLSYRDELTDQEINQILAAIGTKIEKENYDAAFQWVEQQILEYPDCDRLILHCIAFGSHRCIPICNFPVRDRIILCGCCRMRLKTMRVWILSGQTPGIRSWLKK